MNPDGEIRERAESFCQRWKKHRVSFVG
jgi:hypothetical protein